LTVEFFESSGDTAIHPEKFTLDLEIDAGQLVGTKVLYDREGVYSIRLFFIYDKELRRANEAYNHATDGAETLLGV